MATEPRIRRAKDSELEAVVAPLWLKLVAHEASLSPRFSVKPNADKEWLAELVADREASRADVLVAERADTIVGFVHVRATRGAPFHTEDRLGFVDGVWVETQARKSGVGRALVLAAESWCRERRLTTIEAAVVAADPPTLEAYRKLGFVVTAATVSRPIVADPRRAVAKAFDKQAARLAQSPYHKFEQRVRRLVEFARPEPTHRVLEVGCGPGVVLSALAHRSGRLIGAEISPEMARRAQETGAEVVLAAAEHLPFKASVFDRVVTRATLHHLPDARAGIEDMTRVIAPSGAFVVEDLVTSDEDKRAERHNELERLRDPSHQRMLSERELRALTEESGLLVEDSASIVEARDLDSWLKLTSPDDASAAKVRELAEHYAARTEFDDTGLRVRNVKGDIRFDHTHFLLRAVKPADAL